MSKFFIMCSLLVLASLPTFSTAEAGWRPDRPGRPGDNRPGRPGENRPPVNRVVFVTLDTFRVQKFIETTNTIRVNHPNVVAVKFAALSNDVEIVEARLLLENGREVFMDGVTGGLRENRSVTYTLNGPWGERVRSITVRAMTRGLIGSRADLQVSVGVFQ